MVESQEQQLERRQPQQHAGKHKLQDHACQQGAPRDTRTVLAEQPDQQQKDQYSDGALQGKWHGESGNGGLRLVVQNCLDERDRQAALFDQ